MFHAQIEMAPCERCGQLNDSAKLAFIQTTEGFDPEFGHCCSRCAAELRNDFEDEDVEVTAYLYFRV